MATGLAIDVVKRGGRRPSESFKREKLYASVLAACLSVRSPDGQAAMTADQVCVTVISWCTTKPEVTSNDLRRKATESLETFQPQAAYLYKNHRLVI